MVSHDYHMIMMIYHTSVKTLISLKQSSIKGMKWTLYIITRPFWNISRPRLSGILHDSPNIFCYFSNGITYIFLLFQICILNCIPKLISYDTLHDLLYMSLHIIWHTYPSISWSSSRLSCDTFPTSSVSSSSSLSNSRNGTADDE